MSENERHLMSIIGTLIGQAGEKDKTLAKEMYFTALKLLMFEKMFEHAAMFSIVMHEVAEGYETKENNRHTK